MVACALEEGLSAARHRGRVNGSVTHPGQLRTGGHHFLCEPDGACDQVALDQFFKESKLGGCFGLDWRTAHDHFEGLGHAQNSRQTLRSAGARQQPDVDLWQADLCAGCAHPVMAGQRQFAATAQCQPGDCGHHGFRGGLDLIDQIQQMGRCIDIRRVEFADVGAA